LHHQQESGLNPPGKILAATKHYRDEQDIVGEFLRDQCEVGAESEEQSSELYKAYSQYARDMGYEPLSHRGLNTNLRRKGFQSHHESSGTIWDGLTVKF
jgi:putative DNA primase/helicase